MSRPASLLPREDVRDAALFFVVAALCFLAALGGLCARSAYAAADDWTSRVTGEITVRVRGDDAAAARAVEIIKATPGIAKAGLITRQQSEDLLKPWLGAAGVPADLPLPHLIAAEAVRGAGGIGEPLAARLKSAGVDATVDDHLAWSAEVTHATDSAGLAALAAVALL